MNLENGRAAHVMHMHRTKQTLVVVEQSFHLCFSQKKNLSSPRPLGLCANMTRLSASVTCKVISLVSQAKMRMHVFRAQVGTTS